MIDNLVGVILQSAERHEYRNENGGPIKLVIGLDSGAVLRGHLVSRSDWFQINSVNGEGNKIVNGETRVVPGSWPADLVVEPDTDTHDAIYLTMVEFLSGDTWVSGCSVAVDRSTVIICGDQYFSRSGARGGG
ncbi:MAG: hypothetical protein V9F06_15050 [Thermomicrobiales bacterium]|jgi:hypothetical protein